MANLGDDFRTNYDAISAATKGAAPANHVLWTAIILTFFEAIVKFINPDVPKRMQGPNQDVHVS